MDIKSVAAMERKAFQARVAIRDLIIAYGEIDQLNRWIFGRVDEGLLAEPSDDVKDALDIVYQWIETTKTDLQARANNWTIQAASLRNAKTNNGGK